MRINGVNRLACKVLVQDVGKKIKVEPILGLPVEKDLIVDMELFFDHYKAMMPYLVDDGDPPNGSVCNLHKRESALTTPPSAFCARPVPQRVPLSGRTGSMWDRQLSSTHIVLFSTIVIKPLTNASKFSTISRVSIVVIRFLTAPMPVPAISR